MRVPAFCFCFLSREVARVPVFKISLSANVQTKAVTPNRFCIPDYGARREHTGEKLLVSGNSSRCTLSCVVSIQRQIRSSIECRLLHAAVCHRHEGTKASALFSWRCLEPARRRSYCVMARRTRESPTMPSRPIMPTSMVEPSIVVTTVEVTQSSGNQTQRIGCPTSRRCSLMFS